MQKRSRMLPVYVALFVLVVFGIFFFAEFVNLSKNSSGTPDDELASDTYMALVEPLLVNADPDHGAELMQNYTCLECHGENNAGKLAPGYTGLGSIAGERRPPLQGAAYIYESIIYPGAFVVEGYENRNYMPRSFGDQIPDDELGDIIAYLLNQ